jgi:hypothetical protein
MRRITLRISERVKRAASSRSPPWAQQPVQECCRHRRDFGSGNDFVRVLPSVTVPVLLHGGADDDALVHQVWRPPIFMGTAARLPSTAAAVRARSALSAGTMAIS